MATKKTAVIPEEEILAAATDENINEHALHQTETEPEPDRVLSAEGAPGDADLIDICQSDLERPLFSAVGSVKIHTNGTIQRVCMHRLSSYSIISAIFPKIDLRSIELTLEFFCFVLIRETKSITPFM